VVSRRWERGGLDEINLVFIGPRAPDDLCRAGYAKDQPRLKRQSGDYRCGTDRGSTRSLLPRLLLDVTDLLPPLSRATKRCNGANVSRRPLASARSVPPQAQPGVWPRRGLTGSVRLASADVNGREAIIGHGMRAGRRHRHFRARSGRRWHCRARRAAPSEPIRQDLGRGPGLADPLGLGLIGDRLGLVEHCEFADEPEHSQCLGFSFADCPLFDSGLRAVRRRLHRDR